MGRGNQSVLRISKYAQKIPKIIRHKHRRYGSVLGIILLLLIATGIRSKSFPEDTKQPQDKVSVTTKVATKTEESPTPKVEGEVESVTVQPEQTPSEDSPVGSTLGDSAGDSENAENAENVEEPAVAGTEGFAEVESITKDTKDKPQETPQDSKQPLEDSQNPEEDVHEVIEVIDGDTINVSMNGVIEKIRLIGIDTPEINDPRKPAECFGLEASNKAKTVLTGKKVRLEADNSQGERDKYDRLLRYVFLEDGTNFNKMMISEGYAFEYTYNLPYRYQSEFKQAEQEARDAGRGLWAADACSSPSEPASQSSTPPSQSLGCKYSCSGPDRDCSDFRTHVEAVEFWNCCGFTVDNDPMRLDSIGRGDGVPCEKLP